MRNSRVCSAKRDESVFSTSSPLNAAGCEVQLGTELVADLHRRSPGKRKVDLDAAARRLGMIGSTVSLESNESGTHGTLVQVDNLCPVVD